MKYLLVTLGIVLVVGGGVALAYHYRSPAPDNGGVACTMEAKICPDGSVVGRTGPKCEFAECPAYSPPASTTPPVSKSEEGSVLGRITLGPTCPIARNPPDPNCAPRPYQTYVNIINLSNSKVVKTIKSDSNGQFSTNLSVGSYRLDALGAQVYPRCSPVEVKIIANKNTVSDISCDTGIR